MNKNIGKLTAELSQTDKSRIEFLLNKLNENIKPANTITEEDVHIRCMYIVSDEINSYGGKFPLEELVKVKELIVDSPVLIGHQKDQLPIGRNFYAEQVVVDDVNWVKSYFYWMKNSEQSETLLKNIDGGVIKECSIGFTFVTPVCSICSKDIRTCRHEPFGVYLKNKIKQQCYFYYTNVERVLEASLVYRGAVPNTSISNDLKDAQVVSNFTQEIGFSKCTDDTIVMITPRYEGMFGILNTAKSGIEFIAEDGTLYENKTFKKFIREYPKNLSNHFCQIVGYRGKERCSLDELNKFLNGQQSIVKRLELKLFPTPSLIKTQYPNIEMMRYDICTFSEVESASSQIKTKDGVRVWSLKTLLQSYQSENYSVKRNSNEYQFVVDANKNAILSIDIDNQQQTFLINRFNKEKFNNGNKFISEQSTEMVELTINKNKFNSGLIKNYEMIESATILELAGVLQTKIAIQSVHINGRQKYQIYKTA